MEVLRKFYEGVGWVSDRLGRAVSYLLILLVLNIVYDVFARYVFNAPTIWSFMLSCMTGTAIISLGMAHVYYHNANVRVDVIYSHLPLKARLIIDIVLTAVVLFPLVLMLTRVWALDAWHAFIINEISTETIWYPPLFPIKAIITTGFGLLFLQSVATFVRDLVWLRKGGEQPWSR
jgi:TRAP-type mannitol/chloroaromatic compound transport system permease small subunit